MSTEAEKAITFQMENTRMHTMPVLSEDKEVTEAESQRSSPVRDEGQMDSAGRARTPKLYSPMFHRTPATSSIGSGATKSSSKMSDKVLITQSLAEDEETDDESDGADSMVGLIDPNAPDISQDNGYDTDLDVDDEKFTAEEVELDPTSENFYIQTCNELGVIPVSYFMRHVHDRQFKMRFHGLGPNGARAIAKPLEANTRIERLNLEGNQIECDGAISLAESLKDNFYVTELILSENHISAEGAAAICAAVRDNTTVKVLDLSGNNLTDKDGEIFKDLLVQNTTLYKLLLRNNRFGAFAAKAFKEAMMENATLKELDLSWNELRLQAAVQMADLIKENYGLQQLKLSMNGFGLNGARAVGVALRHNRSILGLDLSYNRIPDDGALEIARGLKINDSLTNLNLSNNPITNTGALAMLTGVKDNDNTQLYVLNIASVLVDDDFEVLHKEVEQRKMLTVIHGGLIGKQLEFDEIPELDPIEAYENKPMTKLKRYIEAAGMRLVDVFKQFDKDVDWSLSYHEFKKGIRDAKIDISDRDIDQLLYELDGDGDGKVQFGELIEGEKSNRSEKREIAKYLQQIETGEIEKPAEKVPSNTKDKIAFILSNVDDPNTISGAR